jgi:formylglycine-generating enzyme required for sulfatase activity
MIDSGSAKYCRYRPLLLCAVSYVLTVIAVPHSQTVNIPAGTFLMGGALGEDDESPAHNVSVAAFKMQAAETSNSQYDSCVTAGKCTKPHYEDGKCIMWTSSGVEKVQVPVEYRKPDLPVTCIDWRQASRYCDYRGMRLPTEAEWEYAALAGSNTVYAWGDARPDKSKCVFKNNRHPAVPKSFLSNPSGLFDMTGNVWEWTSDRYEADYYKVSESENPKGPAAGRYMVIRGGGWYSNESQLRIKNRQWMPGEYGEVSLGVRCVK